MRFYVACVVALVAGLATMAYADCPDPRFGFTCAAVALTFLLLAIRFDTIQRE